MESKMQGKNLICTYKTKEEREKHIIKMCEGQTRSIHIYSNGDKLMAEYREVE